MEMIANMNTPMAMMVAGINIAQADLKQVFCHYRLYWLSFVKLIVMPFALVGVFYFVPVSQLVKTIVILATACPAGVTGSLFALRYEKDSVCSGNICYDNDYINCNSTIFYVVLLEERGKKRWN